MEDTVDVVRVVAGAIVRQGRLLAARRGPTMSQAGLWELPGGKVEVGEADELALARELAEELSIEVAVGPLLAANDHRYGARCIRLVAYGCSLPAGEPVVSEHDALRWLRPNELDELPWAPADIPLLGAVRDWMTA